MSNTGLLEFSADDVQGYRLKAEIVVKSSLQEVFDFFSSAENLEMITPPWLNFRILTPMPVTMKRGALLDYKIRLHMIPIRWRTEIAQWQPPFKFVDQQLRGPYKRWWHEHTFEDLGGGRTLVRDEVHYIPRGGSLLHRLIVKPDLVKIFSYRQERLAEHFTVDNNLDAAKINTARGTSEKDRRRPLETEAVF